MTNHTRAGARIERGVVALAAIAGSSLGIPMALAQAPTLTVEVGKCVVLESPEERFACYEAQVDAAKTTQRSAPTAAQKPPAPPEPLARVEPPVRAEPPRAEPPPARVEPLARPEPRPRSAARADERLQEFVGTVTGLRETVPNSFVITLDSGQVWRQTRPDAYYKLRPGQKVRIYQSEGLGRPFRLEAADRNGFIQVERVQ
jgi:hypothetical protein